VVLVDIVRLFRVNLLVAVHPQNHRFPSLLELHIRSQSVLAVHQIRLVLIQFLVPSHQRVAVGAVAAMLLVSAAQVVAVETLWWVQQEQQIKVSLAVTHRLLVLVVVAVVALTQWVPQHPQEPTWEMVVQEMRHLSQVRPLRVVVAVAVVAVAVVAVVVLVVVAQVVAVRVEAELLVQQILVVAAAVQRTSAQVHMMVVLAVLALLLLDTQSDRKKSHGTLRRNRFK